MRRLATLHFSVGCGITRFPIVLLSGCTAGVGEVESASGGSEEDTIAVEERDEGHAVEGGESVDGVIGRYGIRHLEGLGWESSTLKVSEMGNR